MARNTGKGWRIGQVLNRYQQENQITGLYDIYNALGDYLRTKKSPGPWKGIEVRKPMKPPRK
jgi:hypothetical protein